MPIVNSDTPQAAGANPARQGTADLAKGIAVLLMVQVHLMEVFADPAVYHSAVGRISLFLGGPFVAPVYMAVLGYFVAASKRSTHTLLIRGAGLLLVAALLNFGLNFHLLLRIFRGSVLLDPLPYLFGADILFLAGLGILILTALKPVLKKSLIIPLSGALLVALLTPSLTELLTVNTESRYLLAFVAGRYAWSYFPLFPWLAYPLLGFAFAIFRQQYASTARNPRSKWAVLMVTGLALALTVQFAIEIASNLPVYYHHGVLFFVWTAAFLCFWFAALSLLHARFQNTAIFHYVDWLGKNVTSVYVIQWLIIGNIGTALYRTQTLPQLVLWCLVVVVAVSVLERLYLKFAKKRWRRPSPPEFSPE